MTTDGPINELHAMADKLKLDRRWFQNHHPNEALHHYDLTKGKRFQALRLGAVEIATGQDFLAVMEKKKTFLETEAVKVQKYYQPYTLPKLPRRACPFEIFTDHARLKPCQRKPGPNGWCDVHAYCAELLELASSIACPELAVNSSLVVVRGLANWEDYAVHHPISRHKELMAQLLKLRQEYDAKNRRMIEEGLAIARQNRKNDVLSWQEMA